MEYKKENQGRRDMVQIEYRNGLIGDLTHLIACNESNESCCDILAKITRQDKKCTIKSKNRKG